MAAVLHLPEQKVILKGVSWETYERLLAEHEGESGTRFAYDSGVLEILVPSARHEKPMLTNEHATRFLAERKQAPSTVWLRAVRAWARGSAYRQ